MAFEDRFIVSTRNGVTPVGGYRDDLAQGDVIALSLNDMTGVSSVAWNILGRPEGSVAGGAGPEPIFLGTSSSAAFTVDSDAGAFHTDGTYTVEATINPGAPSEVRKTAIYRRLTGLTIPGPGSTVRQLAKLGGFESLEDTSVTSILQGWATMVNRWFERIRGATGGGGISGVQPGVGISIDNTTPSDPIVNNTGVIRVQPGTNVSVDNTDPHNPIVNAAGAGGALNTMFFRSNIAGMAGIATSGFLTSDEHVCRVGTVGDFFYFVPGGTATVDGITVVASTDTLGQWHRMGITNPFFLQKLFWSVSNSAGLVENQGWGATQAAADAVPITWEELNRRFAGSNVQGSLAIHVLDDTPTGTKMDLPNLHVGQLGTVNLYGTPTQVGSNFTISTYSTANPATGAGYLVTATGLGSAHVGLLMQKSDGTTSAIVQSNPATNRLRIGTPASGGVLTDFATSQTIKIFSLTKLPRCPFVSGTGSFVVNGFSELGSGGISDATSARVTYNQCTTKGGELLGNSCVFVTVGFFPDGSSLPTLLDAREADLRFCSVRGNGLQLVNNSYAVTEHVDVEAGVFAIANSKVRVQPGTALSAFNCSTIPFQVNDQSILEAPTNTGNGLYGSNNSNAIASFDKGSRGVLFTLAQLLAATSAAAPILSDGVGLQYADVADDDFDASTGTAVTTWQ